MIGFGSTTLGIGIITRIVVLFFFPGAVVEFCRAPDVRRSGLRVAIWLVCQSCFIEVCYSHRGRVASLVRTMVKFAKVVTAQCLLFSFRFPDFLNRRHIEVE